MKKQAFCALSISMLIAGSLTLVSCGSLPIAIAGANLAGNAVRGQMAKNQKADKLPEAFSKPTETFDDPELSMEVIRKYISKEYHVDKIVVGPGPDFDIRKDDNGLIVSKVSHRYIVFSYKDDKTGKCYYNDCFFGREYEGGGQYGGLRFSVDDNPVELKSCDEVK